MKSHQTVIEIARRLPALRRRDVQDVLDVLTELWLAELTSPDGEIHIRGLGTLYVETHALKASGVIRSQLQHQQAQPLSQSGTQSHFGQPPTASTAPVTLMRQSVRFRPYRPLRQALKEGKGSSHE